MRIVLCAAILLGGGSARAQAVTEVTSAEDVRAMCSEGNGLYTVALGSRGFALESYDATRARLGIDAGRGLHGKGFDLVLHSLAGGRAARDIDLAMPVGAVEAAELVGAHERGQLGLRVTFELAKPTDGNPSCATVVRVEGEGIRAAIEPVAFEVVRGSERIASAESPRLATQRENVTQPRVVVAAPMLTTAGGRAGGKVAKAASALAPRLLECYRIGLASEPSLRGAFVAGVEVAADGRVASARAELDGLGAPAVTSCVLRIVRASRFPAGAERLSIPMRFTD